MKKILSAGKELNIFDRTGDVEIFYNDSHAGEIIANAVLDLVVREADRLNHLLSAQDPESEISELNRKAGSEYVRVSRETMHLLYMGKIHAKSTGKDNGFKNLHLMPQGSYGYGYDESMAADPYGGYIGGLAMLTSANASVAVDDEAVMYTMDQISDILNEFDVTDAIIRIGDVEMNLGKYAKTRGRKEREIRFIPQYNAAGA